MGAHSKPPAWWRPDGAWFLYGVGFGMVGYGIAVGVYLALHP